MTKKFGANLANHDVSFQIQKGHIHAIVGENGAGKSTAMKLLFGLYQKDSGEILLHGKAHSNHSIKCAIQLGIGMVHQHFMLAETFDAVDNILLGNENTALHLPLLPPLLNLINRKRARKEISALAQKYGMEIPLNVPVGRLSVSIQQKIEILKLLYQNATTLILDEPTAVLTPSETDELFANLTKLKNEGKTIVIVTHKLREILSFTDHITVFRAGTVVGELPTAQANEEKIASLMMGKSRTPATEREETPLQTRTLLQLNAVSIQNKRSQQPLLDNISLHVSEGEIVGIAGVEGNGQSELLDFIWHPEKYFSDSKSALGSLNLFAHSDLRDRFSANDLYQKIGFIPEDRHRNGLLLDMSLEDSYLLGRQKETSFCFFGIQRKKKIASAVQHAMQQFDIRPPQANLSTRGFSGGNQQKMIVARELGKNPNLILAANPTRGVDIGAIELIHNQLLSQRNKGVGILLISTELDEIIKLSDRVLVLCKGRITGHYKRNQFTETDIGLALSGGSSL